jgi:hypothetical protein
MKTTNIYNGKNLIVGRVIEESNGIVRLLDKKNNYLGQYIKHSNTTFDKKGRRVGTGNVLMTLLGEIN